MAKARILAVDDQRYFRVFLEDLLVQQGFEVRTAGSGDEALHLLERESFDVVVTDLVMPGLSGAELVERVKARTPEQDVIVVTSVGDVRTAVEAMRTGASDYLLKPLDPTLLERSLDGILQRKRLRQEHASLMAENLEYLGHLSLYERTLALFSTLAIEPLADRIVEGLCLEARAQGGVAWIARSDDPGRLRLAAARGLVRVEREVEEIALDALPTALEALMGPQATPFTLEVGGGPALAVPLRHEGRVVGFVRLTDKLAGSSFEDRDRVVAERFAAPAAVAVANALRFRALEHRSFRDPVTRAYTYAFFEDVVRNEIRKAGRFGRSFSLIELELADFARWRRELTDTELSAWLERFAFQIGRVLRTTDLLATASEDRFAVLLPETDALGAAVLKRRMRELLMRTEVRGSTTGPPRLHLAAVSFPVDGTQIEELRRMLAARLVEDRESIVHELEGKPFPLVLDALAARGQALSAEALPQVLRFVLGEVERRSQERGLLCLAPGPGLVSLVREELSRFDPTQTRTEVVLVADEQAESLGGAPVTHVAPAQIGTRRPFLVYYAEGPGYALVGEPEASAAAPVLFQTADRVTVEHLAFQLQRALGVPITR
jgi:diguanylate cyclase (GGDEF)-like protein